MSEADRIRQGSSRGNITVLLTTLLLTAVILLCWGHFKPLDQDEVFVLQTDSAPTVQNLIEVQRHTPISLDPLFFHLLGHSLLNLPDFLRPDAIWDAVNQFNQLGGDTP